MVLPGEGIKDHDRLANYYIHAVIGSGAELDGESISRIDKELMNINDIKDFLTEEARDTLNKNPALRYTHGLWVNVPAGLEGDLHGLNRSRINFGDSVKQFDHKDLDFSYPVKIKDYSIKNGFADVILFNNAIMPMVIEHIKRKNLEGFNEAQEFFSKQISK